MNIVSFRRVSSLLGFAALTIVCGGLSAQAQTTNVATGSSGTPLVSESTESLTAQTEPTANTIAQVANSAAEPSATAIESTAQVFDSQPIDSELPTSLAEDIITTADSTSAQQSELTVIPSDDATEAVLAPEATAQASAADLIAPSDSQTLEGTSEATDSTVAQVVVPEVEPGSATRSSSSYFGIGGNFGITGDTAVGNQSLAIFSKIGLIDFISVRPSALVDFANDATFMLPVSFDLPTISPLGLGIGPYIGGGLAISTDEGIGGAIIAGLDAPVTSQFTLNAGVNVSFVGDADLGVQVGIGYNFFGF